ncbi:hypothetical protein H0H92_002743 [Tricholoma furcatifolium]|nr:hypothetical protein H0H92_002743 [Tricholoma furcatifolium]
MTPYERAQLQGAGSSIWKNLQVRIPVLLLYGTLAPLAVVTVYNLISHRGLSSNGTKVTVGVIVFSFLAATGLMISSVALNLVALVGFTHEIVSVSLVDVLNDMDYCTLPWSSCVNWLSSLPPTVNDALIIWRAWVIFKGRRWAKFILIATWILTAGTSLSSIILDPAARVFPPGNEPVLLTVSFQLWTSSTGVSFATNLIATAFITYILRFDHRA